MLRQQKFNRFATIILSTIVVLVLSSKLMAQEPSNIIFTLSENALANLNTAIKSDNPGLRKSAIYLVGKHSIEEASETLLEQLELEKSPSLRILITRVLYIIGSDECMSNIYKLASNDNNLKVRKMATAIYEAMRLEKSINIADISNKF
ncbi:MAG: hypothetical protein GY936_07245 [Ignavibacteriae bacterium]|nr:hypothetical protein [Ignavibacteriota bacterium]